jgi:hypothetical protein
MITGVGTGNAALLQGGTNGLGRDALENAAQVDTGETRHVALLLTPDYGEQRLRLYIGQKGFKSDGTSCGSCTDGSLLLARNGLAFGSWFYLQGSLPSSGTTNSGTFGTVRASGLYGSKLEDVSTNPNNPKQGMNLKSFPNHLSFTSSSSLTRMLLRQLFLQTKILACIYLILSLFFLVPVATFLLLEAPSQSESSACPFLSLSPLITLSGQRMARSLSRWITVMEESFAGKMTWLLMLLVPRGTGRGKTRFVLFYFILSLPPID